MNDDTRTALDADTPVNPYSLLDALNRASARTHTLWLIFLAAMVYLFLAVAAVTHRDLLLNSAVVLPILQARIDLVRFFVIVPAALALLHLGLLAQFVLVARKALEFDASVRLLESTDLRTHPLRLELDSFFFVQAIAGPERSRVVSGFLNAIAWLTLAILPLLFLLYVQVVFLPFHDALITAVHRGIVVADLVLLVLVGVFLMRAETNFLGALLRLGFNNPGSLVFGLAVVGGAAFATVVLATVPRGAAGEERAAIGVDGAAVLGFFPRHLNVADADLAAGRDAASGGRPLSLRGRDLRSARLDRVDLRQADLTGANLDGASLAGADLSGARLRCADGAATLQQSEDRQKARCFSARRADFTGARMADASLAGADLRGARLDGTTLDGADLSQALLAGASLERARLRRANLAGATLNGATFVLANLQGANLTGARLQTADFSSAGLQGANLSLAHLAGAVLREADLEGAELQSAKLYGADLRGARLQAADLAGAMIWRAAPPAGDAVALADLANIVMKQPAKDEIDSLKSLVSATGIEAPSNGERPTSIADLLKNPEPDSVWAGSTDGQAWAAHLRASEAAMAEGYKTRLAEHLGRLGCRARFADGAVAAGVARRAAAAAFKGEAAGVYERLKAADCPASKTMPPPVLLDLAAAVERRG
jgi:uncharacterized protein YjbI with pentapeptide repeats